ncbi:polysaccharide deacetylase family protein [Bradyrhizobium sp. 25ACV]
MTAAPPNTQKVPAVLVQECVQARFFLVAESSAEFPKLVRRIAPQGHTVAHHSWLHPMTSKMSRAGNEDIERGIAGDEMALKGESTKTPPTPFSASRILTRRPAALSLL